MTPLLDALIRIIALADADKPDKAVIVVMTDGQENASKEVTREGVKAALERVKAKGWEVVFLGANFDNIADASSVGVGGAKQMAMSAGTMNETMVRMARKSRAYAAQSAPIEFDAADREVAKEANVKNKT
jgi:Mg-chelatase subunit ChlD